MAQANKADVVPVDKSNKTASTTPAANPFDEMERMFNEAFPGSWMRPWGWQWHRPSLFNEPAPFMASQPKVDVIDRDNEVLVRAELPGVTKDDIDISLTEHTASIKATISKEDEKEEGNYYRKETMRGEYARTVSLPASVDTGKANAKFNDGLLEIVMPKIERAKQHNIKIE